MSSLEEIYGVMLQRTTYGDFVLTDAIRPPSNYEPKEGYAERRTHTPNGTSVPMAYVAASREKILSLFDALLQKMPPHLNVTLTSRNHDEPAIQLRERVRHGIDRTVLQSILAQFDDLLLNDGFMEISVWGRACEIGLDDHKILYIIGDHWLRCARLLNHAGIPYDPEMTFIHEMNRHIHMTADRFIDRLAELTDLLGCEEE